MCQRGVQHTPGQESPLQHQLREESLEFARQLVLETESGEAREAILDSYRQTVRGRRAAKDILHGLACPSDASRDIALPHLADRGKGRSGSGALCPVSARYERAVRSRHRLPGPDDGADGITVPHSFCEHCHVGSDPVLEVCAA